jgi:hypothetical protein
MTLKETEEYIDRVSLINDECIITKGKVKEGEIAREQTTKNNNNINWNNIKNYKKSQTKNKVKRTLC